MVGTLPMITRSYPPEIEAARDEMLALLAEQDEIINRELQPLLTRFMETRDRARVDDRYEDAHRRASDAYEWNRQMSLRAREPLIKAIGDLDVFATLTITLPASPA